MNENTENEGVNEKTENGGMNENTENEGVNENTENDGVNENTENEGVNENTENGMKLNVGVTSPQISIFSSCIVSVSVSVPAVQTPFTIV